MNGAIFLLNATKRHFAAFSHCTKVVSQVTSRWVYLCALFILN